jgi:hypothetical protein
MVMVMVMVDMNDSRGSRKSSGLAQLIELTTFAYPISAKTKWRVVAGHLIRLRF